MRTDTTSPGFRRGRTPRAGPKPPPPCQVVAAVPQPNASDGDASDSNDFTAPGVEFNMPRAQLSIPTIEVGDLVSTTLEFAAHGSDLLTGNEISVKYLGGTSHTQSGYLNTSSNAA